MIFSKNIHSVPRLISKGWAEREGQRWDVWKTWNHDCLVVGTGGTTALAELVSRLLIDQGRCLAQVIKPGDYLALVTTPHPLIVISYSGKTLDCKAVLQKAKKIGAYPIILITGNGQTSFREFLPSDDFLLLISEQRKDWGFVPSFGLLLASFLITLSFLPSHSEPLDQFLEIWEQAKDRIHQLAKGDQFGDFVTRQGHLTTIIGSGLAWPAVKDLETKLIEGGLGPLEVSESKDYSHGRFMDSMKDGCRHIVFGMEKEEPYQEALVRNLGHYGPLIELTPPFSGPWGALSLLCQSLLLAGRLAEKAGVDLAKPPQLPPEGLELYHWEWE